MKRKLFKFLLFIFPFLGLLLLANSINEVITKNPFKEVNKISANKNREHAFLSIDITKLNPIKINATKLDGEFVFFDIPKENIKNYTYYIANKEDVIPHELMVNGKEVQTETTFLLNNNINIGFSYEIIASDSSKDTIKISARQFKNNRNIYIALYDKDKKDVIKLYNYENRIRRPRSYIDMPNEGTVYLGAIRPGAGFYKKYKLAEDLWWFSEASGGRSWYSDDNSKNQAIVTNLDNLKVDPLSRKFLDRVFLGSSFDFLGRATYENMNYDLPGNPPIANDIRKIKMQSDVTIMFNDGTSVSIHPKTIGREMLDNNWYPGWSAKGVLSIPPIKSYWRHGVFQGTNIWYEIYGQIEYKFEDKEYVAGMYEIDNTNGKLFNAEIKYDLQNGYTKKTNVIDKIQFLLQRGAFKAKATVEKNALKNEAGGKLVKFSQFKGYLKEKYDENIPNDKRKSLFYAEYGGNYRVEKKPGSTQDGLTINRTDNSETSGIVIPNDFGTGLYTVDLRYKNSYGDYLQYDPKGGNDNYDTFLIEYLDNRPDATATINLKGFAKNSYGIFAKDGKNNLEATNGSTFNSKKMILELQKETQIPNTVHKNTTYETASQKVVKLKVTRISDGKTYESTNALPGRQIITVADDVAFGFESNGDFRIEKKEITVGKDTYIIEPFNKDNIPLGKMTITVTKDEVESVGNIQYDVDKLLFTSSLDGWFKLDGSFSQKVGDGSNQIISKMIKETNGSNNSDTISKINIKEIISVAEYDESDRLVVNNKKLTSSNGLEIFSKDSNSSEQLLALRTGQAILGNFFELKINGAYDSKTKKIFKVIYKDKEDKSKSYTVTLNIKENSYHTLKYEVNMSDFTIGSKYTFNLTPSNFGSDESVESTEKPAKRIIKKTGEINGVNGNLIGLGTAVDKFELSDLTLKINKQSTDLIKLSDANDNYSISIIKNLDTSKKINGLNMEITKITDKFPEEKTTLKYFYKGIIPLGEIEFKLNSAGRDFVYGEGYLDLTSMREVLKDQSVNSDYFSYFKFYPYKDKAKRELDLNAGNKDYDAVYYSNGRYENMSSFGNLPWFSSSTDTLSGKTKIEIVNGDFYIFTNGNKVSGLDNVVIEKDGVEIERFKPGETFESNGMSRAKSHRGDNLTFAIDNNGSLHIGGLYGRITNPDKRGIYKLNFYENNIKKGEFILNVYSKPEYRPEIKPITKSEDTLIIEVDKRIKQLFTEKRDNFELFLTKQGIWINARTNSYGARPVSIRTTKKEFYDIRTQNNNQSSLDSLLTLLTGSNLSDYQNTNDLKKGYTSLVDSSGREAIILRSSYVDFYMYKSDFENTDEIERNMYYKNGGTEKAIKIIIRFIGDDKKTIDVPVDVSDSTLGEKISDLYTLNIPNLIIFDKSDILSTSVSKGKFSISSKKVSKPTTREYVKISENKNEANKTITFDGYRYAKAFLNEEIVYTIKYYDIEMQDIRFNIVNKGTEGRASIDMSSRDINSEDYFVAKTPKSDTLTGEGNIFTLTNISGDILDTRILTGTNYGTVENNSKKIELDGKDTNISSDTDGKIQAKLGTLQIGIGGTNKAPGSLFIKKEGKDYTPKVITIVAKDENDNILSKFVLDTIVDAAPSIGKIKLTLSKKLYDYMVQNNKFWITQDGDIASSLSDLSSGFSKENYKNFMKVETTLSDKADLNGNSTISWDTTAVKGRNKITGNNNQYSKVGSSDVEIELPNLNGKYDDLKSGKIIPKILFEPDSNNSRTEKFVIKSGNVPYSFDYEIVVDNDSPEEISGNINTFPMPKDQEITFSESAKKVNETTFNIPSFMKITYANREPYNSSDYSFIKYNSATTKDDKTIDEKEKQFSIYGLKMLYSGKDKNEISLKKTSNTYTEPFTEAFDMYYKNVKLGTYNITFENIPVAHEGSAKLNLSEFNPNSSATFKIKPDGDFEKITGDSYEFKEKQGSFPYANMNANNLEIKIRKKGDTSSQVVTLNNTNKFVYTDMLNSEEVLKFEFGSNDNEPTFKITKLSETNDPKSNDTTYEIVFNYKKGSVTKNLGKYDLTVIRNEKDLGLLTLKAKPFIIVNPLHDNGNGTYKVVNGGTFNNIWEKVASNTSGGIKDINETFAKSIQVNKWLKVNDTNVDTSGKVEFKEMTTNEGSKKESITLQTGTNVIDLIKKAKYEYMLPGRTKYLNGSATEIVRTKFTFTDINGKYYKLDVEHQYDVFEKQEAKAMLVMTKLKEGTYEFDLNKDSYTNDTILEKNDKKYKENEEDEKEQNVKLTNASGQINLKNLSNGVKLRITKDNKVISDSTNTKGYKYTGSNYDIELRGSTLKITKKSDAGFEDNLVVEIVSDEDNISTTLIKLDLTLKSESKFAISGEDVLDFKVISYSPFDATNLARGEKIFTVTGANGKTLEFAPSKTEAVMTLTNDNSKTINVQDIKIIKTQKDTTNTDQYFFTMEAYAVTKPNMTPGIYKGEVDVTITIKPDSTP